MWVIFLIIVGIIVYLVATKDKRAEERENRKQEFIEKKQKMLNDPASMLIVEEICNRVTDLSSPMVGLLRLNEPFWLIFENGSVFIKTLEDNQAVCLLNRINLGKNPLHGDEEIIFRECVCDKLKDYKWLSIRKSNTNSNNYNIIEYKISKQKNEVIPEAF